MGMRTQQANDSSQGCAVVNNKKSPWPLVRERTIPIERPPHIDEIWCQFLWIEGCRVVSAADPLRSLISVF
jgi:hypothetical protein